jgi:hypothetical protein
MFFLWHSRICPAWSPSEHLLTPALSPFGACIRSHAIQRRLFLSLMTAAHISPNVFSLREFLSPHHYFLQCIQYIEYHSYLLYITFICTFTFLFTCLVHNFITSDLLSRLAAHRFLCLLQFLVILAILMLSYVTPFLCYNCYILCRNFLYLIFSTILITANVTASFNFLSSEKVAYSCIVGVNFCLQSASRRSRFPARYYKSAVVSQTSVQASNSAQLLLCDPL